MYIPSAYRHEEEALLQEIIEKHSFATMIITQDNHPNVVHLPLLFDSLTRTLKGHIARANPISRLDLSQPYECLVIFQGPDAYVSPSWYATKVETGKVVPTWNYIAVHVHGTLRLVQEAEWVLQNVSMLSDKHEAEHHLSWKVDDAPPAYISSMLRAIVGVEVTITSVDGKFKLSQNKSAADVEGVISGLRSSGSSSEAEIANWMVRMNPSVSKDA